MTELGGGTTTMASRLVVAALATLVVGVGVLWLWTTMEGALVAGAPPWVVGLVLVGLVVALALAVTRLRDDRR